MSQPVKKASIISVGNEVLSGRTVDTNAAYIARRLIATGLPIAGSYTVADDTAAIKRALALALDEADVVVVSGGLGATDDDLTRQALADFLGVKLVLRDELLVKLQHFFDRRGFTMPQRNDIQAYVPRGAEAMDNAIGTAPGIAAETGGRLVFAMPGVPTEMQRMFEASVLPRVRDITREQAIVSRRLKCFGAGESTVATMLGEAMQRGRNPLVNCTVHAGVITLEIVATAANGGLAQKMVADEEAALRQRLGQLVYGVEDQNLADVVGERLARAGQTLAVAESCTGGLLAQLITDTPGASRYFTAGWVTYGNEAKSRELGVPPAVIDSYGAVSEQVARAMAEGARRKAEADYALAITGVAGPTGGTEQKPVGLVYIALGTRSGTDVARHLFSQDRQAVRLRAAQTALNTLRLELRI